MEFLDEESRPKFQFQSRIISSSSSPESQISKINKPVAFFCVTLSILTLIFTILSIQILPDTIAFLLFWFSISFLVGPFAPTSITAGDIRVGQGELLEDPTDLRDESADEYPKKNRRNKSRRPDENLQPSLVVVGGEEEKKSEKLGKVSEKVFEEKEWIDADFDLLKKQIVKFPVGTPRRWEMIAEAFKGRHGVDSVIKMAKSNSDRKQPGSGDSFSQFLKQRKPIDKRMDEGNGEITDNGNGNGEVKKENSNGDGLAWSSAEDIALLNALKAFPKDSAMRWEKIAVAVPGKSKAACMKRVAELKKGFRSSKASTE